MTTEALNTPPDPQTLEISLFGSGIGECVVVHLGNGEWMVVDSCRHAETNNPVALHANPSSVLDREKSGVREMGKILHTLLDRKQGKAPGGYRPHRLTQVDQLLYEVFRHAGRFADIAPDQQDIGAATRLPRRAWEPEKRLWSVCR